MPEVQSFTLDLENRGLMIARPGDVLPQGYLTSLLNMTASRSGYIASRRGSSRINGTALPSSVHSQGRIIINGTAYTYQGASTILYRAFASIATGLSGNPLTFREGGPELAVLPQMIIFDSNARYKDDGTTTTNFGIAGPLQAASAVPATATTKTIDLFEYATNGDIQTAWPTTSATITTTTTDPKQGTYAGNLAVVASTTGYATRTVALNLDQFSAAGDSDDSDWIVIYLRVDQPTYVDEIRVMFDVDPATNTFTHNFYWKSVTANVISSVVAGTQTAVVGTEELAADIPLRLEGIDNIDDRFTTVPPVELATGINQWLQIFVRKSEFTRVGTHANNWANVAAIRIQIKTNAGGTVNLGMDGMVLQGSLTARLDATNYGWIYRYENEKTGTVSPFSPEMVPAVNTDGTTIEKTKATVTVRNPRDTQASHIQLYRRGGQTSEYSLSVRQAVTAWTGTTTISDGNADADLGAVTDETQIEMANLLQTPSAISTSVRKTLNNGSTYTDYTSAVGDDNAGTFADLSSLDTVANGDWVVIGADGPFRKILVNLNANVNTNASVMTISYWDGAGWRAVLNLSDGTSASSKTLAQDGTISFDFPERWERSTIDSVAAYYVRLSVSAALSGTVQVEEIRLSANAFDPTTCEIHGERIWCDDTHHTDRVWYSRRFSIEEFDEDAFIIGSSGGDPVVRPYGLDDQLFVFTRKTIKRVIGSSADSFQAIETGAQVGLFSKYAICRGLNRVFFRAYDGIYEMYGNGFAKKISLQIDPIFHGYASEDGLLLAVQNASASTETMEFFDASVRFGYTDSSSTRVEIVYDLETERWEPTDRPVTSYLRLDDQGQYYSGHTDGFVYLRDTNNQDHATDINIRFRTPYLDMGVPAFDKALTEIQLDADLVGESVTLAADFNNGQGVSQSLTVTNAARGIVHLPLDDDTEARNVAVRVQGTNGGSLVKFYKVTFFFIVRPAPIRKILTDWDDLGYAGDKRLRQLQLEIDTNGANVSVAVQVDGVTSETLTVNTSGRRVEEISLAADTIGKLVRLVISGAAEFSYYRHQFEFIRDPLNTTRYDTFELDFGYTRWKYIRRVWIAGQTPATATMAIWIDEALAYTTTFSLTSLSGSGWTKTELRLPPGLKGKVFRFVFTSSSAFKIFLDQSDVEWAPLSGARGYQRDRLARSV